MKTGAVIVAAGMSSRMGAFKPMLKVGSISTIRRIIFTLQQAGADPVVVVTGNRADILEKHVSKMGVICLRNPEYASTQMLDSAKIGFRYLLCECGQVLFTPVDIPLFTVQTAETLMASGADVAIPLYGDQEGHPLLISTGLLPGVLQYEGENGLRGALDCSRAQLRRIPVEDEGVLFDADTPEDFQNLLSWHNAQLLHPQVKIELAREEIFLTPDAALLLRLIDRTESVRTACRQMNLSYSKGWTILNQMEKQLDYSVVVRHPGGMGGGHTSLSDKGRWLLRCYDQMVRESNQAVKEIYQQIFKKTKD
ncbi:NTP transferase domain-containing protein [Clostridium sp. KNHs216]|uniref:NTP transferase domain-containing protein n=1 Tax=Clostridium sp. KNHs216 TaxID=1550235 RepID=UPI001153D14D|nr:NTP transferase domain-containing protein [Clostridium sp. KNHs216]TQI68604.1 molybdate transport repressor ModE-like protein [Clostridium sp. KNHs216]